MELAREDLEKGIRLGELIHGLAYEDYAAIGALRASFLTQLKRSPAHHQAELRNKKTSPAMEFGKIFHSALENGERFMDLLRVEPIFEGRTQKGELTTSPNCKEVKEKRAEWYSQQPKGSIFLKQEDSDRITGMLNSMYSHSKVKNIIKDGMREVSGVVRDPETGLLLKFRPDLITTGGHIVDYKSTRDASYWFFHAEIFREYKRFYILSAAHYAYCAKLMGLKGHESLIYIAIENEDPYGVNVFPMDLGCLEFGEKWRKPLTELYARCLETNTWRGYDEKIQPVSPPEYEPAMEPWLQEIADEEEN